MLHLRAATAADYTAFVRPHVPLWCVRDQGELVGLTRFWRDYLPDCGLCIPFRAASPDIAAHLLHGALGHGEIPELELSVVDPGVADALVAAGARDHARLYEMGGSLDRPSAGTRDS